jgi:hypothetical protein
LLWSEFSAGRQRILDMAALITPENQDQSFLGTWSIKDLLAHLVGWDHSNIAAVKAVREGKLPSFYGYIDKDWHSYNARLVGLYKKGTMADLIRDAQVSQQVLMDLLAALPARDLFRDFGVRHRGYKVTIARLIEAESKDERRHFEQVKDFVAQFCQETEPSGKGEQK